MKTSDCVVLVGTPVLGPALIMWAMTIGVSVITASPIPSAINDKPGPEVAVMDFTPALEAPIIAFIEAISSSIWITTPPRRGSSSARYSIKSELGVMG